MRILSLSMMNALWLDRLTSGNCHFDSFYDLKKGTLHQIIKGTGLSIDEFSKHLELNSHILILEGFWFEQDEDWRGMWRIRLK